MKNYRYITIFPFYPKINQSHVKLTYDVYLQIKTAKLAPVWTTILNIRAIVVHQTLTEHALYYYFHKVLVVSNKSHFQCPFDVDAPVDGLVMINQTLENFFRLIDVVAATLKAN